MDYRVKEVADMVGISVRTLHHYDEIGLLNPAYVNEVGYRYYSDNELERLQQIMFFKELKFELQEIKEILDNPNFDRKKALEMQKDLLVKKRDRLDKIVISIEKTLESIEGGLEMNKKDMFKPFDMSEIENHKEKYAEETKKKYGDTDAYKESEEKIRNYTKYDWAVVMEKGGEIFSKIAANMDKGPEDSEIQELIGEYRQYITDSFYTCTLEIFRGLGELYVYDERFTKNIDKYAEGLSEFLKEAIAIYCDNVEK